MASVPVLHLPRVFHVGSLDLARRGELHRTSQEGPCLSVSLCPDAWGRIARIGGDLHALEREDATFLDVTALLADREAADAVLGWAESQGLVERRTMWRAWYFDDEAEDWRHFVCSTRDEAERETEEVDEGPDGGEPVEPYDAWIATGKLGTRLGCEVPDPAFAADFAAMVWARDAAPDLVGISFAGVWFSEIYDPDTLSAPRGGIFPEAVAGFQVAVIDPAEIDDEQELGAMPEPVLHLLPDGPISASRPAA